MRHLLRIAIVALLLSLVSQATWAQYATLPSVPEDNVWATSPRQGQGITNVGKTLMYTGASVALTGAVIGTVGWLTYEPNGSFDARALYPIFTILGGTVGGVIALTGLPVYVTGKYKMNKQGASLMTLNCESQHGFVGTIEFGGGLTDYVSLHAMGGYNVSHWLYVGAGMGYGTRLNFGNTTYQREDWILPIYGNLQLSCEAKEVAPYMSTSVGYDLNQCKPYTALEFGTRIRTVDSRRGTSWWVGTKSEYLGTELYSILLTAGKSF